MDGNQADPLQHARRLVIAALRDPASVARLRPRDLDLTLRLLRRVRLLARLDDRLQRAGLLDTLPTIAVDQLLSARVAAQARQRAALWELDRIAWALDGMPSVPLVALKGCAYLLAGTPNARGRGFGDVDLLVPEAQLPAVEARLRERGWAGKELTPYDDLYYRRWTHELPPISHAERGVEVDLHHAILMRTARLKPASELLFTDAPAVPGSRFAVLAPADMVLHAIVHLFYGSEMDNALRDLVDVADLLEHFGATEPGFWGGFWTRAEALNVTRPAWYALRYVWQLLGTQVPGHVSASAESAAPAAVTRAFMDRAVPLALFPVHPDLPCRGSERARLALYVRSHWVKMPPLMLARHLATKAWARSWAGTREP